MFCVFFIILYFYILHSSFFQMLECWEAGKLIIWNLDVRVFGIVPTVPGISIISMFSLYFLVSCVFGPTFFYLNNIRITTWHTKLLKLHIYIFWFFTQCSSLYVNSCHIGADTMYVHLQAFPTLGTCSGKKSLINALALHRCWYRLCDVWRIIVMKFQRVIGNFE